MDAVQCLLLFGIGLPVFFPFALAMAIAWVFIRWSCQGTSGIRFQFRITDVLILVSYASQVLALGLGAPKAAQERYVAILLVLFSVFLLWYMTLCLLDVYQWKDFPRRTMALLIAPLAPALVAWILSRNGWKSFDLKGLFPAGGEECLWVGCLGWCGIFGTVLAFRRRNGLPSKAFGLILGFAAVAALVAHFAGFKAYGTPGTDRSSPIKVTHTILRIGTDGVVETRSGESFRLKGIASTKGWNFESSTEERDLFRRGVFEIGKPGLNAEIVPFPDGTADVFFAAGGVHLMCGNGPRCRWLPGRYKLYCSRNLQQELLTCGWASPTEPAAIRAAGR